MDNSGDSSEESYDDETQQPFSRGHDSRSPSAERTVAVANIRGRRRRAESPERSVAVKGMVVVRKPVGSSPQAKKR